MALECRWDPCVAHRDDEVNTFILKYFDSRERCVLFIGGAGFDPRSTAVTSLLATAGAPIRAVFFQENRPNPALGLVNRANTNTGTLTAAIIDHEVLQIEIFGSDGGVVGSRDVVSVLNRQSFCGLSDVVIDTSALSVGINFPIIRYFVERIERGEGPANLHVFVAHDPTLDAAIQSIPSDVPGYVHGFKGGSTLDQSATAAKLWLPQLAAGQRGALGRLHEFVDPHDTCPILPFPASDPRLGDKLAEEFLMELETGWSVDTRNILYAAEDDPLDLYRTILRLDDLRKPVFQEVGGSLLVLSPIGSKVMALGALMAALERDLPVAHLESIGYDLDGAVPTTSATPNLLHVWLEGDVYPQPRPEIRRGWTTAK